MKKFIIGSGIIGTGLVAGGCGLLAVNGYDILNPEVWSLAGHLARTQPGMMIDAALNGPDKPLFRGLSFVFLGLSTFAIGMASASVLTIISALRSTAKKVQSNVGEKSKPAEKRKKKRKPISIKAPDISGLIAPIKDRLSSDKEIDLEEGTPGGKFVDLGEPEVVKQEKSKSTKHVRVKRSFKDEVTDLVGGLRARFGLSKSNGDEDENLRFGKIGGATKQSEFGILTEWYAEVQSGTSDQDEMVARARKICDGWADADFSEYASLDPLNGAFVVRLVRSWADREDDDVDEDDAPNDFESDPKKRDKEAMRAAFRAIKRGEYLTDDSETEVDLDQDDEVEFGESSDTGAGEDYVNLDEDEDDFDTVMAAVEEKVKGDISSGEAEEEGDDFETVMEEARLKVLGQGEAKDDDEEEDDSESVMEQARLKVEGELGEETDAPHDTDINAEWSDDDLASDGESAGDFDELASILAEMRGFASICQAAVSGEEEWPEDWADEESREEHAIALSSALEEQELFLNGPVMDIVEENRDAHEEFEWAMENAQIFEEGYAGFIRSILVAQGNDGNESDDQASEDLREDQDSTVPAESPADVDSAESAEVVAIDSDEDDNSDDGAEMIDAAVASVEEGGSSDAERALDNDCDESELSPDEASVNPQKRDLEPEGSLQSEADEVDEADTDTLDETDRADEEVFVAPNAHEPKDLGIPPYDEIEEAGSIPYEWGRNCKLAGATDGSIAKLIFAKESKSFKPLGVAHVVMLWKKADGAIRLNVILKKVPEGDWAQKFSDGVRMENQDGDFVEIASDLLEHPEIVESKTIVHFYGEGVQEFDDAKINEGLMAISRVMSKEEIQDFIKK